LARELAEKAAANKQPTSEVAPAMPAAPVIAAVSSGNMASTQPGQGSGPGPVATASAVTTPPLTAVTPSADLTPPASGNADAFGTNSDK
jgi:hypothetical protein